MDVLFFAHLLNALLMIAMPIGLAIYLTRTWKLSWRLWLIGAATFILSQVGHIPFLRLSTLIMNRPPLINWFLNIPISSLIIFNGVFVGLSAGLFEEFFRYGMYRWWAKDARSWHTGILTGAGHGGVEAIYFGGLALYTFFQLVAYRNIELSTVIPATQLQAAEAQVATYWSSAWYEAFLPSFERLSTIIIQISLAVLVLQTFTRKQWFWVWLAVSYHALIDFFTVPASAGYISKYGGEAIVGEFAILSVIIIFALHRPVPAVNAQPNA
ncbi:MAG: YhfC family glutamic-type intramembrane protease [Anaerolineales bacterium]